MTSAGGRAVSGIVRWGCLGGDMNCDGSLNQFDIAPFVLALSDNDAYAQQYPNCELRLGDANHDGSVNQLDIDGFVQLLGG